MKNSNAFFKVARPAIAAALLAGSFATTAVHAESDPTMTPRPAEIMPNAASSLMLAVTQAGNRLVAVGQRGHILTSDNGTEWTQQNVPVRAGLISVDFPTANTGYAVGKDQTILKTTDGGKSWKILNFAPAYDAVAGAEYRKVKFFDADNGFIAGAFGTLLRTNDGGKSFYPDEFLAGQAAEDYESAGLHMNDIVKLGDGSLAIVGESGLIRVSTDDGATWRMTRPAYAGAYFGALPVGQSGLVVYGQRGTILRVDDVHALADQDPEEFSPFQFEEDEYFEQPLEFHGFARITTPNPNALMGAVALDGDKFAVVGQNAAIYIAGYTSSEVQVVGTAMNKALGGVAAFNGYLVTAGLQGINLVTTK